MERRSFMQTMMAGAAGSAVQGASPGGDRVRLYSLMGDLPPRDRNVSARMLATEERPGYILERLVLDLNGMEPAPAYFVKPKGQSGRAPVVLYNHAHGGQYKLGKDELLNGRVQLQTPPYAEALTARGYCALCFDTWAFGERATRTELDIFKDMLWVGQVMWGMMVYDSLRALDYLAARPDVDPARMATVGLSMGSTMAWWVAALDERVKVCVDLCCLTDFDALREADNLKGHGIYYYVPSLRKHFTTARINALIAPRAHLSIAGNLDALTPVKGLEKIDHELREVYRSAGHPERWKLVRYDVGHQETPDGRREVMDFLGRYL